jgi:hypothetical protein
VTGGEVFTDGAAGVLDRLAQVKDDWLIPKESMIRPGVHGVQHLT